jgi:competence protein ComEA
MFSAKWRSAAAALAVGMASALLLGASGADAAESRAPKPAQADTQQLVGVVNINTATPEQLELLPGIGPAKALAIVEDRKAHGPFERVDDLVRVSGIGEQALLRLRAHVVVRGKTTARAPE